MRRFILAAVSSALVLTACSDRESPTEPQAPAPEETFGSTCTVERFPLLNVATQIAGVFPKGRLRLEALARAGIIKLYWDTCHEAEARRVAVAFINWMNLNFDAGRLPDATAEEVQTLTVTVLNGVGIPVAEPATAGGIGVGLYTGEELLLKTADKTALTKIDADAFDDDDPRVIVAKRLEDGSKPLDFDQDRQFAPFFDYDATKLSGEPSVAHKKLKDGKFAIIAFCLFAPPFEYPDNARIGHNQVVDDDRPTFELLDPFDLRDDEGELTELGQELDCGNLDPTLSLGGFGQTLPGFAQEAWRSTRELARAIFLPQPLFATAVGFLGPIAGKTTSLSPFGVVDIGTAETGRLEFAPDGDPGTPFQRSFEDGAVIWWNAGCEIDCTVYPRVRLVDGEGFGIAGVPISVTLVHQEGLGGSFGEGSTTPVTTTLGEGDAGTGYAEFSDLVVNLAFDESENYEGLFTLVFSAEGVPPVSSGAFRIAVF